MYLIGRNMLAWMRALFLEEDASAEPSRILLDDTVHYRREFPSAHFDGVFIACQYDAGLERDIARLKYHGFREYAHVFIPFYESLIDRYLPDTAPETPMIITGVPIHWSQFLKRGFNQTTLIARALSQKYPSLHSRRLLRKVRYTRHQAHLSRSDRLTNPKNAYTVIPGCDIRDATIILIDDVISTGATFDACAKALKQAGVRAVYGFFLASRK